MPGKGNASNSSRAATAANRSAAESRVISPDKIILDIDDPDWSAAHGVARDFRSCTKTVAVGPILFAAHGPSALQSFQELQLRLIVNTCLCTCTPRILDILYQMLIAPGVVAASILATENEQRLASVVRLAESTTKQTYRVDPPAIFARVLSQSKRRRRDIRQQTLKCQAAGITGVIADAEDLPAVFAVHRKPTVVIGIATRTPHDYRTVKPADAQAGVKEILQAGADYVLLDTQKLRHTDVEWAADMADKEVREWKRQVNPLNL